MDQHRACRGSSDRLLVQEDDFTGMSLLLEGDADDSNIVSLTDFSLLASNFGQTGMP